MNFHLQLFCCGSWVFAFSLHKIKESKNLERSFYCLVSLHKGKYLQGKKKKEKACIFPANFHQQLSDFEEIPGAIFSSLSSQHNGEQNIFHIPLTGIQKVVGKRKFSLFMLPPECQKSKIFFDLLSQPAFKKSQRQLVLFHSGLLGNIINEILAPLKLMGALPLNSGETKDFTSCIYYLL